MQSPLKFLYPERCVSCGEFVEGMFGLCGECWGKTPFITGTVCDCCGTPLPGEDEEDARLKCDDCMVLARPWSRGRSALLYKDNARRLVLALKHGDRLDLARPVASWMARALQPLLSPDLLVIPIPIHWTRLFRRRYNQAAILAQALARQEGLEYAADLLIRPTRTKPHDGMDRKARFENMEGALAQHPKKGGLIKDRHVLLVDDVMTSGATFAAAADVCNAAGACDVFTLSLARVAKDT